MTGRGGGGETESIAEFIGILENAGNLREWTEEQKINIIKFKTKGSGNNYIQSK